MPRGEERELKAAKALALPTRSAMLAHLLRSGPLTAREVAEEFSLHANVARAHLDLLEEAGYLMSDLRRQPGKGRPAKIYYTWEGEMLAPGDWEVSRPAQEAEGVRASAPAFSPSPYRLIAAILVRLVGRLDPESVHSLAEAVAREEGRKLVLGYRDGGLDFAAAVRGLVEELRRFAPQTRVLRLEHDYAEIETPDCPFREIALEHSDLVQLLDPALHDGAMIALGHPSDVELEESVARGDAACRIAIRRRPRKASRKKKASPKGGR